MTDTPKLTCHILDTGFCWASEHHLITGGQRRKIECHSIVALLEHPQKGWLLWDTGYAPRMLDATKKFPFRLYRWMTPMVLRPELAVVAQLERFGISANDVKHVIISHFHGDHIAGLRDFPTAEFLASKAGFDYVSKLSGWKAVRRAFIPELLPDDFSRRVHLLPEPTGESLNGLGPTIDLFDDGSAKIFLLPGHARGQIGMLAQTQTGPMMFIADSCWMSDSYRLNKPPHWMTNFLVDSKQETLQTIANLHLFAQEHQDITLIPTHCPEMFQRFVQPVGEPLESTG